MLTDKTLTGHAAVIGAGVMGAGIAAMLANFGWTVDLLDRVPVGAGSDVKSRNRLAQDGLDRARAAKPPLFALPEYASRVRVGNTADDLGRLPRADWIVEAVAEDLALKRAVLAAVAEHAGPLAVITSNTSGLDLAAMVAGCPEGFRRRFFGAHFFNPPRYMKPVELIQAPESGLSVVDGFEFFADRVLGKRVIRAEPTPGFISTRLGMYALCRTIQLAVERSVTVEQADYLTGPLIGRPRSGTFRLADVVGLDVTASIADYLASALPTDAAYQALQVPEVMRRLVAEGRTGAKAGAGFYRREGAEILSLDLQTGEYRARQEPERYPADVESLPLADRLRRVWELSVGDHRGFLRAALQDALGYMADVTPKVAERIIEVDDALTGGFGWEMGPFHTLDALGHVEWPGGDPELVRMRRQAGEPRYYRNEAGQHWYFDFDTARMEMLPRRAGVIVLKDLKKAGKTVEETDNAALVDLGDGVACLEWRTKMGTLNPELVAFFGTARRRAEYDFAALVVVGGGEPFSAGFDLNLFAAVIEARDWTALDGMLSAFQQALHGFTYAAIPIVGATAGYALGGGCETLLYCSAVQAAFESAIGLPEANVGLIPAGGGTTQMLIRATAHVPPGTVLERSDPFPFLQPAWDNMRLARYSSSADEARKLGYLRDGDGVTRLSDRLLHDAKERALALAAGSREPLQPRSIPVMAADGYARLQWEVHLLRRADRITQHDARIALALARVLTGGDLAHPAELPEQCLLDLEREAFLSLAGTPETLARIRHMLATGKPLKN